jgi:CDP-glucose 4,6-dehydratase
MFWKGKRVFITGHTGFKGSWLSFWLNNLGAEVCGFSLAPNTSPNLFDGLNLANLVNSTIGDIRDLELLRKKIAEFQPEIVFHLAAQPLVRRSYLEPIETYSTNVMGTINVLEAIRSVKSVKSVVVVTTDKVYENFESTVGYTENDRLGGFDPYSNSKACAELAVSAYRNSFFADSETLIATARAGNVIGGGDWSEHRLLPDVFRSLIFGKELIIRNPNSVRPWQHVLDPLNGYMMLAERLFNGDKSFAESWNFGPEEEDSKSVGWILEEIKKLWDGEVHWKIAEGNHPHETNFLKLDSSKTKIKLIWKPKINLLDGLSLTNEWFFTFRNNAVLNEITKLQIEYFQSKVSI